MTMLLPGSGRRVAPASSSLTKRFCFVLANGGPVGAPDSSVWAWSGMRAVLARPRQSLSPSPGARCSVRRPPGGRWRALWVPRPRGLAAGTRRGSAPSVRGWSSWLRMPSRIFENNPPCWSVHALWWSPAGRRAVAGASRCRPSVRTVA
jgi:hypothetical protein